jgi:ankyrin repeat protein
MFICFGAALVLNLAACASMSRPELSDSASRGDIARVQKLVSRGANINETDSAGQTPLMHAISKKQTKTAIALVNMGANINLRDKNGNTALSHAISDGNRELVVFLLEKGADIKQKDNYGYSCLHMAACYDQLEISKILLKNNVNINEKNSDGDTPLHVALIYRAYDVARLLVDCGADINAQDNDGSTPLHFAVKYGQVPAIKKYLSKAGFNQDKNPRLIIEYILSKNPDTALRDSQGYTPQSLAVYYKNKEMAGLLAAKSKGTGKYDQDEEIYGVIKKASRYKIIRQTDGTAEQIRDTREFKIRDIDYSAVKADALGYSNAEDWNVEKADVPKTYAGSCSALLKEAGAANRKLLFIKHDETVHDGVVVEVAVKRIVLNWDYVDKKPDVYVCDISFTDSRSGRKLYSGLFYITSRSSKRIGFGQGTGMGIVAVNPNMPDWEGTFTGRLHIAAYNMAWIVTKIMVDGKIDASE